MTGTAEAPRRSGRRRAAGLAAGLAILVFLVLGAIAGWDKVADYEWDLRPELLVAGMAVMVAFYAVSAVGWVVLLERVSGARVQRVLHVGAWGKSLLGRYVPGNVLMVASRLVLGHEAGIPRRIMLAATVYEQVLILGAASIGGLALLALYGPGGTGASAFVALLVPLALVALHPRVFGPVSAWALRKAGREPLPVLLSGRDVLGLLALYLVAAALLGVGVWLVVRSAVGSDAGSLPYVGLSFLLSFVVSTVAFVFPSGLGVREGVFAALLSRSLPSGVAIALSAGSRLVLTAAELLFVGLAVLVARRSRR